MKITIIKRKSELELSTMLNVGLGEETLVRVFSRYRSNSSTPDSQLNAFLEQLISGASFEACFDELDPEPVLDEGKNLADAIEKGKQELLSACRQILLRLAQRGREAQQTLKSFEGVDMDVAMLVPPDDSHGICSVCHQTFHHHCIGGTFNLCMDHINPNLV